MLLIIDKFVILFILVLFIWYTNANYGSNEYFKREHSLVGLHQGSGINFPFWDFEGNTLITNSYVRLTPDLQSKSGSIWNQVPCMSKNWEVYINFKVHGQGKELYGDGFAIWYVRDRMIPGSVFGSMDKFSGLAIIVDTYSNQNGPHNHQHPYISAMVNNGTLVYDHDRDGTHTQLAGCEAKFRNVNFDTAIRIRYENDILTVWTNFENNGNWRQCITVVEVHLPTHYYFGLSATTGDLSDNHDVYAFKFYDLDMDTTEDEKQLRKDIIPRAKTFEPPRPRTEDPKPGMSNIKIFFLLLLGMLSVVAVTIFGLAYYKEKNSRKHFY